jgi:hypothetical protein
VECRAGTSLFGHSGGVDGGTVRIFLSLWLCSGGYGTVEMVRVSFLCFLQFAVSSLGGWMSAVGILCYIFLLVACGISRGFLFYKLLIFPTIYYRWFRRSQNLEKDQEPLLERMRLEHQKADLETRLEFLEADVAYLRSDYLFLNDGDKKDAMFATICGLDSEIAQLKSELAIVTGLLSSY